MAGDAFAQLRCGGEDVVSVGAGKFHQERQKQRAGVARFLAVLLFLGGDDVEEAHVGAGRAPGSEADVGIPGTGLRGGGS